MALSRRCCGVPYFDLECCIQEYMHRGDVRRRKWQGGEPAQLSRRGVELIDAVWSLWCLQSVVANKYNCCNDFPSRWWSQASRVAFTFCFDLCVGACVCVYVCVCDKHEKHLVEELSTTPGAGVVDNSRSWSCWQLVDDYAFYDLMRVWQTRRQHN